ncbi:MAG: hypothetical protein JWM98_1846 [Thermoleophilia bacterium]|nr:hypothetical protein [Thermoleophilia bacterium]
MMDSVDGGDGQLDPEVASSGDATPNLWGRARARRHRFMDRYEQRRAEHHGPLVRPFRIAAGGILLALSPVVGAIPGPGGMFLFLPGAFLLASEYRRAAIIMDRVENETIPRLRRLYARLRGGPKPEWVEEDPQLWGIWEDRRAGRASDTGERRRRADDAAADRDDDDRRDGDARPGERRAPR